VVLQRIAFGLIGLGVLAVIGWGVSGFFTSSEVPLAVRIGMGAIAVGVLVLVGIAIKDRVGRAKKEGFKEVDN
jgi:hypothetical protein